MFNIVNKIKLIFIDVQTYLFRNYWIIYIVIRVIIIASTNLSINYSPIVSSKYFQQLLYFHL